MKNERNEPSKSWLLSLLVIGLVIGVILTISGPVIPAETEKDETGGAISDTENEARNTVIITSEAEARDYLVGQWCAEGGNTVRITVDEDLNMQFETLDASFDPPWWIDQGSTRATWRTGGSDDRPKSRVFAVLGHLRNEYSQTILLVSVPGNQPVDKGTAIGIQTTQAGLLKHNEVYDLEDDCDSFPEGGPPPWER